MIKRLLTRNFFTGVLLGIFIGAILLFFLYAKEIDNLIQEKENMRKKEAVVDSMFDYMNEKEAIINSMFDYVNEIDMIKDWNEQSMMKPEEEGK